VISADEPISAAAAANTSNVATRDFYAMWPRKRLLKDYAM